MNELFANPYDLSAQGFCFYSYDEYVNKSQNIKNKYGQLVKEFEIKLINGELHELFECCQISQSTIEYWFDKIEALDELDQAKLYFLCSNLGKTPQVAFETLDDRGLITESSLVDYARSYLYESNKLGLMDNFTAKHFDYEEFARDLESGSEITQFTYRDQNYIASNFY